MQDTAAFRHYMSRCPRSRGYQAAVIAAWQALPTEEEPLVLLFPGL